MPTEAERVSQLREVHARFYEAIEGGRLEDAELLERQRFTLIDELLRSRPLPATVRELTAIAATDRELLPRLEAAQALCANELRDLQRSRHAARAYAAP